VVYAFCVDGYTSEQRQEFDRALEPAVAAKADEKAKARRERAAVEQAMGEMKRVR